MSSSIDRKRASAAGAFPSMPVHRDTAYVAVADRDGQHGNLSSIRCSSPSVAASTPLARACSCAKPWFGILAYVEGHPNAIAPRKRPFHTIIPGLLAKRGKPIMAFGVMGGQCGRAGHMQILSGVLDRGLDIQRSSDAPRSFAFDGTLSLEPTVSRAVADDLIGRGHRVIAGETNRLEVAKPFTSISIRSHLSRVGPSQGRHCTGGVRPGMKRPRISGSRQHERDGRGDPDDRTTDAGAARRRGSCFCRRGRFTCSVSAANPLRRR